MVGTLVKQPNEKYCIINYAGEVSCYNLTEQDIINRYISDAKACIGAAEHYGNLIAKTIGSDGIPDNILKEIGFDKSYDELVKFVPRRPIHTSYSGHDFTTYGKCPNCGARVENCMGYADEKCRSCGQLLKW